MSARFGGWYDFDAVEEWWGCGVGSGLVGYARSKPSLSMQVSFLSLFFLSSDIFSLMNRQ